MAKAARKGRTLTTYPHFLLTSPYRALQEKWRIQTKLFAGPKWTGVEVKERPLAEKHISEAVRQCFVNRGWLAISTHYGANYRPITPGISDWIFLKHGFVVWCECKNPAWKEPDPCTGTKTERMQARFRRQILDFGGCYVLLQRIDDISADVTRLDAKAEKYRKFKACSRG